MRESMAARRRSWRAGTPAASSVRVLSDPLRGAAESREPEDRVDNACAWGRRKRLQRSSGLGPMYRLTPDEDREYRSGHWAAPYGREDPSDAGAFYGEASCHFCGWTDDLVPEGNEFRCALGCPADDPEVVA